MNETDSEQIRGNSVVRLAWLSLGFASLGLGILGIFLPLLPTTPFLILAAFAFSRSSRRQQYWLTEHPRPGPPIQAWQRRGATSRDSRRPPLLAILAVLPASLLLDIRAGAARRPGRGPVCGLSLHLDPPSVSICRDVECFRGRWIARRQRDRSLAPS